MTVYQLFQLGMVVAFMVAIMLAIRNAIRARRALWEATAAWVRADEAWRKAAEQWQEAAEDWRKVSEIRGDRLSRLTITDCHERQSTRADS